MANSSPVLRLLIDTCVWLDLAKDPAATPVLAALEDMIRGGMIELIVPELVLAEFERNKARVIEDGRRGIQAHLRVVREAVVQYADDGTSKDTIRALESVDHNLALAGDRTGAVARIDKLLRSVSSVPATAEIKERAVERALLKLAPFHREKNSIADAIIFETYVDLTGTNTRIRRHSAFVTHNVRDFSAVNDDRRLPHQDLAAFFDNSSTYRTALTDVLNELHPDLLADRDLEFGYSQQSRRLSEILEAEHLLFRQVWYNRHQNLRFEIEEGEIKVLDKEHYSTTPYRQDEILDTVWRSAQEAAQRTRDEVGVKNLGPWDDFEWGMLNGKLSALRWVLGDDWDMLDT